MSRSIVHGAAKATFELKGTSSTQLSAFASPDVSDMSLTRLAYYM